MAINPNSLPGAETQVVPHENIAVNVGSTALSGTEEYTSPYAVAEVPAEAVTLGAVNGVEQEQTAGYKQMPGA